MQKLKFAGISTWNDFLSLTKESKDNIIALGKTNLREKFMKTTIEQLIKSYQKLPQNIWAGKILKTEGKNYPQNFLDIFALMESLRDLGFSEEECNLLINKAMDSLKEIKQAKKELDEIAKMYRAGYFNVGFEFLGGK